MKIIDEYLMEHPYFGVERMTDYLRLDKGFNVNKKRIRRLYHLMGIQTIGLATKSRTVFLRPMLHF